MQEGSAAEDHSGCVLSERVSKHVALVRFNRPEKRNALHSSMVIALAALLDDFDREADIRCVVITGTEQCFAAGADLREMLAYGPAGTANMPERVDAWRRFESFSKPLIAAVNGVAFGAGNEVALACDFILAGSNARFGQPEVKRGGMAGDGGTQRLPRKVGSSMASYMLLTGEPIDAETALRVGLVVEVCNPSETVTRALAVAETIASCAPVAVRNTKACIRMAMGATRENGLMFEREALWRNSTTGDRQEGMKAFLEKRDPVFTGT